VDLRGYAAYFQNGFSGKPGDQITPRLQQGEPDLTGKSSWATAATFILSCLAHRYDEDEETRAASIWSTGFCWALQEHAELAKSSGNAGNKWVTCVRNWSFKLVGGFNPSENCFVSWDYYSQYMEKICSKPPTSKERSLTAYILCLAIPTETPRHTRWPPHACPRPDPTVRPPWMSTIYIYINMYCHDVYIWTIYINI